ALAHHRLVFIRRASRAVIGSKFRKVGADNRYGIPTAGIKRHHTLCAGTKRIEFASIPLSDGGNKYPGSCDASGTLSKNLKSVEAASDQDRHAGQNSFQHAFHGPSPSIEP